MIFLIDRINFCFLSSSQKSGPLIPSLTWSRTQQIHFVWRPPISNFPGLGKCFAHSFHISIKRWPSTFEAPSLPFNRSGDDFLRNTSWNVFFPRGKRGNLPNDATMISSTPNDQFILKWKLVPLQLDSAFLFCGWMGKTRCESTAVSPCPGKCFETSAMPLLSIPSVMGKGEFGYLFGICSNRSITNDRIYWDLCINVCAGCQFKMKYWHFHV